MTPTAFITLLEKHDWRFDQFPDRYYAGLQSQKRLLYFCQEQPELFRLYNHADNCIIRGIPFNFPSVFGMTPKEEENQHTHTHNNIMTEPLFKSFYDICIKPLVEAINNHAIFTNVSKGNIGHLGAAEAAEAPAPAAEKPAKAPKASKTVAAPAPAPEPEPETPAAPSDIITEARLRATVKTLSPENKKALGEKIAKKLGVQSIGEIPEEHRAGVHAQAIKLGAIDTDPDAPKPAVEFGDD